MDPIIRFVVKEPGPCDWKLSTSSTTTCEHFVLRAKVALLILLTESCPL